MSILVSAIISSPGHSLVKRPFGHVGLLMVGAYVSFAYYYFQHSTSLHLDTDSFYLKSLRTADCTLLTR